MKVCAGCKIPKDINDFGTDARTKDGKNCYCKHCANQKTIMWRKKEGNNEKHKISVARYAAENRDARRKSRRDWYSRTMPHLAKYDISIERYNELLELQNYVCAICKRKNKDGRRLSVDHCHETGVVRGLLCTKCNTYLGYIHDDIDSATRLVAYLEGDHN